MPRVANPPRAKHASVATPHKQSPMKIPLHDDRQEKAVRLQSRHALQDLQLTQIKAAASPVRRLNNYQRAASDSPKTPRAQSNRGKENVEGGEVAAVAPTVTTPMKRVPILANFEEWMKMATDNKINAANSWNFALIDYFHDMSLLKEGDGVNFQKASCTLDGCVKIYTSRVDSVATETGKLLSGLADSGNKKSRRGEGLEGEEGEEGEEEGEEGAKKPRRKAQRSSEATLAPSFASLQLKKFELEFSVDPLFKKTSADFDEGGAKGLLLNHLAIDSVGRIVFDSSDDAAETSTSALDVDEQAEKDRSSEETPEGRDNDSEPSESVTRSPPKEIDVEALRSKFFPDLGRLESQDICPSLKGFDLGDPSASMDMPFLKAPEDWRHEKEEPPAGGIADKSGIFLDEDNAPGFDDDGELGGFDLAAEGAFGEGGDAWARTAALNQHMSPSKGLYEIGTGSEDQAGDGVGIGEFDPQGNQYGVSIHRQKTEGGHEDILDYFDNALQKNWAGPEHWRVRRIKDITKPQLAAPTRRKEKEPFEIDFSAPLDPSMAGLIYTPASSNAMISLPKAQWKSKTRNLLPDDKHFNSRQLLRLFLKPKARMGTRRLGSRGGKSHGAARPEEVPEAEMDEAFWARKENAIDQPPDDGANPPGNYDAIFFQDDGLAFPDGPPDDEDEFADAREAFSPGIDGDPGTGDPGIANVLVNTEGQEGAFGTQLVTQSRRLRPEYVQYAKVAKKVDVRRLKEEMWRGIGFEEPTQPQQSKSSSSPPETADKTLQFTSVMNNLQQVYPQRAMADISTSYCFICLLHLANEKGLTISNEPGLEELRIQKDWTAEITEGAG